MNVDVAIADSPRLRSGFPTVAISLPEIDGHEVLDIGFDRLYQRFGAPNPVALDFLIIAGIVYVLDKAVPRRLSDDRWTRHFAVRFPVSDTRLWDAAAEPLQAAMSFLSGDEWEIGFEARPDIAAASLPQRSCLGQDAAAVTLFSGGLDSLAGTINHLATRRDSLLLLGHHDAPGPKSDQTRLHQLLTEAPTFAGRTEHVSVRVRPLQAAQAVAGQRVALGGREHTLRTRSLLFLALGLYAAHALGPDVPLIVPENGFIAINVPFTPSRLGTCSTRTTHPYFLANVRAMASRVGLENRIDAPLMLYTKGEILANCPDQASLARLAPETVSCAHPSRRAPWTRRHARNCGYCVPCVIRRAALYSIDLDAGTHYGIDIGTEEIDLSSHLARDLRAMLDGVADILTPRDVDDRILLSGPIPISERSDYVAMIGRGFSELRAFLSAHVMAD